MNEFTTVFLFTDQGGVLVDGQRSGVFIGVYVFLFGVAGILFLGFKAILFSKNASQASVGTITLRKSTFLIFLSMVVIGPIILVSGISPYRTYADEYTRLLDIYNTRQYGVAEGVVHVLHTQAYEGHDQSDIIEVDGVRFEVNYYMISFGYTTSISHAGSLTDGTYVRVFYDKNSGTNPLILRVDVRK